ncbi:MAG: hypothetical protein ACO25F_03795 [Erythrobacter sp.]
MMVETPRDADAARKRSKTVLSLLGGGAVGFFGASGLVLAIEAGWLGVVGPSAAIALLVALVYAIIALSVALGTGSPEFGARFLNVEDAEELREERRSLLASAGGMLALAAILAVLALGDAAGPIAPPWAAGLVAGLGVVASWLSLRSFRLADELMRSLTRETAELAYYLCFVLIGGWAVLAHLGFAPLPAMLDILSLMWAIGLLAAFWAAGRRGMLHTR